MRLNHLNLATANVAGLAAFLSEHFGFTLTAMRGRDAFAVLIGSDGFALNLMQPQKGGTDAYPDGSHIGFVVETASAVAAKHAELLAAGRRPGEIQRFTRGGAPTTTFYCKAPGGVLVEVLAEGGGAD